MIKFQPAKLFQVILPAAAIFFFLPCAIAQAASPAIEFSVRAAMGPTTGMAGSSGPIFDGGIADGDWLRDRVRPVGRIDFALPRWNDGANARTRVIDASEFVEIEDSKLDSMITGINRHIRARRGETVLDGATGTEIAGEDYSITAASYGFSREDNLFVLDSTVEVIVHRVGRFVTVPLFAGPLSLTDASGHGEDSTIIVTGESESGARKYALMAAGPGKRTLRLRFAARFESSTLPGGAPIHQFDFMPPDAGANTLTFEYDNGAGTVDVAPAVGRAVTNSRKAGKVVLSTSCYAGRPISVRFTRTSPDQATQAAAADESGPNAVEKKAPAAANAGEKGEKQAEAETAPAFNVETLSAFAVKDGFLVGRHEFSFNAYRGRLGEFSFTMPAGTRLEEVGAEGYDRHVISEGHGGAKVTVCLQKTISGRGRITATTVAALPDAKTCEITLPSMPVAGAAAERGETAFLSPSSVRATISGEPRGARMIDAGESAAGRLLSRSDPPALYAFRYHEQPYRITMELESYAGTEILSALMSRMDVSTVITAKGLALTKYDLDVKNNGERYLNLAGAGTAEIFDSRVNGRPVRSAADEIAGFRVPLVKSEVRNGAFADFPVSLRTISESGSVEGAWGELDITLPAADMPAMAFEWCVFTPDDYVFYDHRIEPSFASERAAPVFYRIPADAASSAAQGILSGAGWFYYFIGALLVAFFAAALFPLLAALYGALSSAAEYLCSAKGVPSVLELLFVFMIVGMLVAVSMPQFAAMTEDAKSTKAKQDCDTLVQAIQKYNSLENSLVTDRYMSEIKGKYITNLDTLKDPWGRRYEHDRSRCAVLSSGPDGKPGTKDDITVRYAFTAAMDADERKSAAEAGGRGRTMAVADSGATRRSKGIFSVPLEFGRTSSYKTFTKKYLHAGKQVRLRVSYMRAGAFNALASAIFLAMLPVAWLLGAAGLGMARKRGAVTIAAAAFIAAEAANVYIPQTAVYAVAGFWAGAFAFMAWRAYKFFASDEGAGLMAALTGTLAPGAPKAAASGGGPGNVAFAFLAAALIASAPGSARAAETPVYGYDPETAEIQTFRPEGRREGAGGYSLVKYRDLLFLRRYEGLLADPGTRVSGVAPAPAAPIVPKTRVVVERTKVTGRLEHDCGIFTAEYFIKVFGEGPAEAVLIPDRAAVTGVSALTLGPSGLAPSGPEVRLPGGAGRAVRFEKPGRFVVSVSFGVQSSNAEEQPVPARAFGVRLVPAPSMTIEIAHPADREVHSGSFAEARDEKNGGGYSRMSARLIPLDRHVIVMKLRDDVIREKIRREKESEIAARAAKEAEMSRATRVVRERTTPRMTYSCSQLVTIDDGRLESLARIGHFMTNMKAGELHYSIPAGVLVTEVEAGGMSEWKVEKRGSGEDLLKVSFRGFCEQSGEVSVRLEQRADYLAESVEVGTIRPLGAESGIHYLIVDSAVNAEARVASSEGLMPVDELETPARALRSIDAPPVFCARSVKVPFSLALSVRRQTDAPALSCAINNAYYRTYASREGDLITTARYEMVNNDLQFLELDLPARARIWSARVAGRLVRPVIGTNGTICVPIVRSATVDYTYQPFTVEIVYRSSIDAIGIAGRTAIKLPKTTVMCAKTYYEMYFMQDYLLAGFDTNMRIEKKVPAYVSEIRKRSSFSTGNESEETASGLSHFGGSVASILPVTLEFPEVSTRAYYFSSDSIGRISGGGGGERLFVEFAYASNGALDWMLYAAFAIGFAAVLVKLRCTARPTARTAGAMFIAGAMIAVLSWFLAGDAGAAKFFLAGCALGAVVWSFGHEFKITIPARNNGGAEGTAAGA